jgi:cysteinyl-tRNA synthetase
MELYLHNTLTRSKELFIPINPGQVGIYSCGPTVYSEPHIGNIRYFWFCSLLRNVLQYAGGYDVTHVMNITDVWHLTDDGDHGEDKMEKGARREGKTARDVAKLYGDKFMDILEQLDIHFEHNPKATDYIQEQIDMVLALEQGWHTYIIPWDGVYFDTTTMADYGVLVGKKHLEGIQAGARVDDDGKRNPTDFALRKFNMTGNKRDMERDSPWGIGFPGWHIECSAMSKKLLGTHFDIHTWGIDHIPIHHTNEIAQSECGGCEHPWVNYWLHTQFLNVDGKKISKSLGNDVYLGQILDKWYIIEDIRMFFLQAHYRSFQDFTWEWLEAAKAMRQSLIKRFSQYQILDHEPDLELIDFLKEQLCDDLNTAGMIGRLFASFDVMDDEIATAIKRLDDRVLKLWLFIPITKVEAPADIKALAEQRWQAKLNKNYTLADELRVQLTQQGRNMKDGKDDYELEKI